VGLSYSLAVVILRSLGDRGHQVRVRLVIFSLVFLGLVTHIGYLQLVHFDYGWNMQVSIGVGIVHSLLWLVLCARRWSDGYHGRMVCVTLGLWACAALEVFDFPPFPSSYPLLDAHAIWHGLTPILGWQLYRWVHDDLMAQAKIQQQQTEKRVV
jgi:hypothetical protein